MKAIDSEKPDFHCQPRSHITQNFPGIQTPQEFRIGESDVIDGNIYRYDRANVWCSSFYSHLEY